MQNYQILPTGNYKQDVQEKRYEYGKSPSQFIYSGSPALGTDM
jgi:hypothetical protein